MRALFTYVRKGYPSGFVFDVDRLEIRDGERLGIVGNNGAGKTTMLLLLLGLLRPDRGDIRLGGRSVRSFSLSWRSDTASYLGEQSLLPFLSPWEFWQFVGDAYGIDREDRIDRLAEFEAFVGASIRPKSGRKFIRDYSHGTRKKIGLVAAMIVRPRLLVLDEPFTNLDPASRAALEEMLRRLNGEHGTTIVVSSHDLEHLVEVSSRILLIENGRIRFDGVSDGETLGFVRNRLTRRYVKRVGT